MMRVIPKFSLALLSILILFSQMGGCSQHSTVPIEQLWEKNRQIDTLQATLLRVGAVTMECCEREQALCDSLMEWIYGPR